MSTSIFQIKVLIIKKEVDRYQTNYEPKLMALGYSLVFKKKTNSFFEGLVIGYKKDKFTQVGVEFLEFDSLKPLYGNYKKGNIAIILELDLISDKSKIIIANTHLHYEQKSDDIRFAQASCLLNKVFFLLIS